MKKATSTKKRKYPPENNVLPSESSRLKQKPVSKAPHPGEDDDEEKLSVGNSPEARWQTEQEKAADPEAFYRVYDDEIDNNAEHTDGKQHTK